MNRQHSIYRTYIALARGEHFTESEIDPEFSQVNWIEHEKLARKLGLDYMQMFHAMIVPVPTKIQHLTYCSVLRRIYDKAHIPWPTGHGFLEPVKDGHLIVSLQFKQLWY